MALIYAVFKKTCVILCHASCALVFLSADSLATDKPGQGVSIRPIFSGVLEERFRGEIAVKGLSELGYKLEKTQLADSYEAILATVGANKADFTVHMWDVLHDKFYNDAGGDSVMLKAGSVIPEVLQGYLIDRKTARQYGISKLEDFKRKEVAQLFDTNDDGKADLAGCDLGWGCQKVIEHHMKAYDLGGSINNHNGPYFKLMDNVIERYKRGKPVLYYTWIPHWISALLVPGRDVIFLEVPFTSLPGGNTGLNTLVGEKNLGFAVDRIVSVINRKFSQQNPAAVKFLSLLQISADDENIQNLKIQKGEKTLKDIKRHANNWILDNSDQFAKWLSEARKVSQ